MTNLLIDWMTAYQRAWDSNTPGDIAALFTEDARYFRNPYSPPFTGRDAIVADWLSHADTPSNHTFTWSTLVDTAELAIIQAVTDYPGVATYSNLWVIRFAADGR